MPFIFLKYRPALCLLLALYSITGCISKEEIKTSYDNYRFDQTVIDKLPLYDSLVVAIIEKMSILQQSINKDDSYQAFRYMPTSTDAEVVRILPKEAGTKIEQYYNQLGSDYILGFDIFKDSTIKIYIRRKQVPKTSVDIEENISYYPEADTIRKREYPVKDTILNRHWQYWARFNHQGIL